MAVEVERHGAVRLVLETKITPFRERRIPGRYRLLRGCYKTHIVVPLAFETNVPCVTGFQ